MKGLPAETDFVVVGPGIAGLRAAIELAAAGRVLILAKKQIGSFAPDAKSETGWLSDEEDVTLHLQDTLDAGDSLCNVAAVKMLIEESPERMEELIAWGKPHGTPLRVEPETARSRGRVLHAPGDSTEREICRVLWEKMHSLKHISAAQFVFVTNLAAEAGRLTGISLLDENGVPHDVVCSAVLLSTGGTGQLYRDTTNPEAATADGVALAARAGAEIGDMEFIQFHPTALFMKKVPRFLLSSNLLAQGAYLRNIELNRFMGKYHPAGERAPRSLVARAIVHEMEVSRAKDPFVYLDLTHMDGAKVQKQFPRIYSTCMQYNIDITEDLIPVRPAAHFCIGGVRTDLDGRTNIAGLFAAGEVATTGLHGANRLPSNSLLEGLVYGARAGKTMREIPKNTAGPVTSAKAVYSNGPVDTGMEELIRQIQEIMQKDVGVVRTRMGMQAAIKNLEQMAPRLAAPKTRRAHEASNLHLTALLVARSALAREESRGAHYRMDYPDHDDKKFLKHSIVRGDKIAFA